MSKVFNVSICLSESSQESYRLFAERCIMECSKRYDFDGKKAILDLGLSSVRVEMASKQGKQGKKGSSEGVSEGSSVVNKPLFPLPYNGVCKEENCIALRHNQGLWTQCQDRKKAGDYCEGCSKQLLKEALQTPKAGTIYERIKVGIYDFVDKDGHKPLHYSKVMKKFQVTKEEVVSEALRFDMVVSEEHFLAPTSHSKRGRPSASNKDEGVKNPKGRPKKERTQVVLVDDEVEDLFTMHLAKNTNEQGLVAEENKEAAKEAKENKEAENAAKEELTKIADKEAAKEAKKLAKKEAKEEATKVVAKEAEKAVEKDAEKAVEKDAFKAAAKEAKKLAEKASAKATKESAKEAEKVSAKAAKVLAKEAEKAAKELAKEAKVAEKATKEAAKTAKKDKKAFENANKEVANSNEKAVTPIVPLELTLEELDSDSASSDSDSEEEAEEEEEKEEAWIEIIYENKVYLKSKNSNIVYDRQALTKRDDQVVVGNWNNESNKIDFHPEAEESEEEYEK